MPVSQEHILHIAHLARLNLENTEEDQAIQEDLSRILRMVDQISAADTEEIEPMAHPMEDMVQRLRIDEVTEFNQRDALLALAPEAQAGLFLVPAALEENA